MQLESQRLRYREFRPSDWQYLHRWSHDREHTRFDGTTDLTRSRAQRIVDGIIGYQRTEPRYHYYFMLEKLANSRVIGSIYAAVRDRQHGSVEIGYRIDTAEWGQGYATEAAQQMLDFAIEQWQPQRIYARVVTENIGSVRVLEKIGMERESVEYKATMRDGTWYSMATYALRIPSSSET